MKFLIVRFSSFGDIVQALPSVNSIHTTHPKAEIHWLTRKDFSDLVDGHPHIHKVMTFDKKSGLVSYIQLLRSLSSEHYTHIYDAHNNLRSWILRIYAWIFWKNPQFIVRSKNRWKRFLFFKLRRPVFKMPFRGALSYLEPLKNWNISDRIIPPPHLFVPTLATALPETYIALAPSAAWPNKRWPLDHWKTLIRILSTHKIVVLGGPEDYFCSELQEIAPDRVINLAGKCSLIESCSVVKKSKILISADTGLLHAADQMGVKNIGLIGPTAFGYTTQSQSLVLEVDLACKPCSKDGRNRCTNPTFQKCMVDITPERVAETVRLIEGGLL